jgi:endonuclease YncB( thermonuclease family)
MAPNDLLARSRAAAYPYVMPVKLIASLFTVVALALPAPTLAQTPPEGEDATLVEVIDGDTINVKIAGSDFAVSVRYIGVDAPEIGNAAQRSTCYAAEATEANRKLIDGHTLRLQKDKSETDRFGRLLRLPRMSTMHQRPSRCAGAAGR